MARRVEGGDAVDQVRKSQGGNEPLAVVGIGCLFPGGSRHAGWYWAAIKNGVDCIREVPAERWPIDEHYDPDPKAPDRTYARRGAFLEAVEFDPLAYGIAPRDLEATDSTQLLALVAAQQALADAGVEIVDQRRTDLTTSSQRVVRRDRLAVILGVTGPQELVIPLGARLAYPQWRRGMRAAGIPEPQVEEAVRRIAEQFVSWQENSFPGLLGNVVAGRIANRLNLGGINCVVDAACASALAAVEMAALELETGRADVVITGGCDTFSDIFMFMCFSKTPALSRSGDARPFDADGDGTILGEGLGLVVLKRLRDAEAAGDRIYAVLRSVGSSSDGRGTAIYAPSAEGQERCLRLAYEQAGVSPATVELVEAHGTGTKVGDATEAQALIRVYGAVAGRRRPWCALGSVKSQIGHTKAAAGAASLIKAVLALHHKVLPPTLKVRQPVEPLRTPDCPFYLNTSIRPWLPRAEHPRRAAVSAFGFGGSNFHAVLEEYGSRKTVPDWDGQVDLLPLGADCLEEMQAKLERLPAADEDALFTAAEQARRQWRPEWPWRLVLVLERGRSAQPSWWQQVRERLPQAAQQGRLAVTDGCYLSHGAVPGRLAVLFPGQGSQYVGMLRELACLFPEMLDSLAEADVVCGDSEGGRLGERIYPPPAWEEAAREEQTAALRATEWAQPALGALSWGLWRVLHERFGLTASAWAGHSYGELVALAAAGCYDAATLWRLSRERGRLLASAGRQTPGAMLAVRSRRESLQRWLEEQRLTLVLANHNGPEQQVLSGTTAEIERAAQLLAQQGIGCVRLPVSGAFHSPLVASAVEPFHTLLQRCTIRPPHATVYANSTACPYTTEPAAIRSTLAEQLVRPVAFADMIQAMLRDGHRCFVEVGPGTVLSRLVAAIAAQMRTDAYTVAIDASAGRGSGVRDLAVVLAQLAALGYTVDLAAWERESRCRPQPSQIPPGRWTAAISGANYRASRPLGEAAGAIVASAAPLTPVGCSTKPHNVDPSNLQASTAMKDHPTAPTSSGSSQPSSACTTRPVSPAAMAAEQWQQLVQLTQQSVALMQRIQEQTAALHKQFLDAQETAQRALLALIEQQRQLWLTEPPTAENGLKANPMETTPTTLGANTTAAVENQSHLPGRHDALPPPVTMPSEAIDPSRTKTTSSPIQTRKQTVPIVEPSFDELTFEKRTQSPPPPVPPVSAPPKPATSQRDAEPSRAVAAIAEAVPEQDPIAAVLLGVVSEKTGYPVESLGWDLALDADLGIDSIKRVEIFSALQERLPQAPAVKAEHLGHLQTLRDVLRFLQQGATAPRSTPVAPARQEESLQEGVGAAEVAATASAGSASEPAAEAVPEQDPIAAVLLGVVSEKTGYPVESLGWDLALDADLGIDSIKRVEIFSALQERLPQAPAVKAEHLGHLQTLRDVLRFLKRDSHAGGGNRQDGVSAAGGPVFFPPAFPAPPPEQRKDVTAAPQAGPCRPVVTCSAPSDSDCAPPEGPVPANVDWKALLSRQVVRAVPCEGGAGPVLCHAAGSVVWLVAEVDDLLGVQVSEALRQRGLVVRTVPWEASTPAQPEGQLTGLVLVAPATDRDVNALALSWLQRFHRVASSNAEQRPFIVSLTRLDGAFGLGALRPDASVWQGGLAGWIKTARREWPQRACKAIDIAPEWGEAPEMAAAIAAEILSDGPVEVGLPEPWQRLTLALEEPPVEQWQGTEALGREEVILITGGGRGVTAEVAQALAENGRGTLVLVGRTPWPEGADPSWLPASDDEAAWKRAIGQQLGPLASPRQIQEHYQLLRAQRELRRTWQRLSALGARVAYYSADVGDPAAVQRLVAEVRQRWGPITRLIHGAGVLADRLLQDLTPDQFERVYRAKAMALHQLLEALRNEPLRTIAVFSSTTARLGRVGQGAYACANEVLNKLAQREARRRPGVRVVAFNWGPWDGGMVTPALQRLFAAEGVGLIPRMAGGRYAAWEIQKRDAAVEVVVGARPIAVADMSGPVTAAAATSSSSQQTEQDRPRGGQGYDNLVPVVQPCTAVPQNNGSSHAAPLAPGMTLAFERSLSIATHPVLADHVLDGRAVVPLALHLEWLAHAAAHRHPGLLLRGCDELRIYRALNLAPDETTTLQAWCGPVQRQDGCYWTTVELRTRAADGRERLHSRASVLVAEQLEVPPPVEPLPAWDVERATDASLWYRRLLFHGPHWQGLQRLQEFGDDLWLAAVRPAPIPSRWIETPLRSRWLADPLVLDAALQLLIIAVRQRRQQSCLPMGVGRYRQYRRQYPTVETLVLLRLRTIDQNRVRADVEFRDEQGLIAQAQDCEAVLLPELDRAFSRNRLVLS